MFRWFMVKKEQFIQKVNYWEILLKVVVLMSNTKMLVNFFLQKLVRIDLSMSLKVLIGFTPKHNTINIFAVSIYETSDFWTQPYQTFV